MTTDKLTKVDFNLMVPEKEKTEAWIQSMIGYFRNMDSTSAKERQIDIKCWNMYNNTMASDRFDYFLKIGDNHLPAYARHVPLQRTLIDILVSKQLYRPFSFSVSLADKNSINEKWVNIIKGYVSDMRGMVKQRYYSMNASIQKLDSQVSQLREFMQTQPQNEQQAFQQQQLKATFPDIMGQIEFMKSGLQEDQIISQKELKELDHYYKFTFKDFKEHLAQKVLLKLRNQLNIKYISKSCLLSTVVTGKQFLYVDMVDGEKWPRYELVDSLKVAFPKISGIRRTQDGPWVKFTENLSFQQIAIEFGGDIEKKYGKDKLKELAGNYHAASGSMTMASTPNGPLDVTTQYENINYSGSSNGSGIKVERVFFKVPREISIKYSPNPYQEGEFFRHFVDKMKIPLNVDNFNYSNGFYIDKENDKYTFNKMDVEKYNESKGEFIKKKYTNDIYEGIVINNDIFVRCRKKSVIRHPDKKSHVKLPIFGPTFSDIGEQPYSIIRATNDLQDLYDFIHTQRELMLSLAGTKTIFYDRGQKPGDLSDNEFFEQMKKGVAYVETIDPATGQPKRSNFNQWSMVDMSVSASIQYLDRMLENIEDTMGNVVGIPRPAKGQVVNTDQVGTFQESINRSQLVTEVLYYEHDQLEAEALTHLLNLALKYSFREGDEFELDDANFGRELVSIPPALFDDSYVEVNVYNSSEELKKMQELHEILTVGIQKGQLGLDALIGTWGVDTVVELKKKVEYFTEKAQEIASQNANDNFEKQRQLEMEKIQYAKQFDAEWKKMEAQIKQQALELEASKAKIDAALKERDLAIKEKGLEVNSQLKAIELQNEQQSETNVLIQNEKHMTTGEQLQAIQMQLDYILKTLDLSERVKTEGLQHVEGMKKLNVENKKVEKTVKEHVSDR